VAQVAPIILTFQIFLKDKKMVSKFSTCEVYGEIGHTALECHVRVSFFQEPKPKNLYMINYFNQPYNN
jgi:hypothetical protein